MSTTDIRDAGVAHDRQATGRTVPFVVRFLPRPIKRRLAASRPDLCPARGMNAR